MSFRSYPPVKFNLTSSEAQAAFGSALLFRRLRFHKWIKSLRASRPGRPALYPVGQLKQIQDRLEGGDFPPPLPSEIRELSARNATRAVTGGAK